MPQLAKFALDSAQCELLLAFEKAQSLADLARMVGRDVSVVSRQLQRLAETAPVIEKQSGRWHLTELGRQMNHWTRSAIATQQKIQAQYSRLRFNDRHLPSKWEQSALLAVGLQNGFQDPSWGARNVLEAESNMERLLTFWREKGQPIFHIQHLSSQNLSPLKAGTQGADFLDFAHPLEQEPIIRKNRHSGFAGTTLEKQLKDQKIETVALIGFSANHCVDATARSAADIGFNVFLVSDAIVAYDRISPSGDRISADTIHQAMLANLNQDSAIVLKSHEILDIPSAIETA